MKGPCQNNAKVDNGC